MTSKITHDISLNEASWELLETACQLEGDVTPSQLLNYLVQKHLREDTVRNVSARGNIEGQLSELMG